jgi:AcrR family transcriptional regulator
MLAPVEELVHRIATSDEMKMLMIRKLGMTREQQKEDRRQAILRSADHLIRSSGSTEFSVGDLARGAGLSTATLYNLIGSKGTVLYILLNNSLDRIDSIDDDLPEELDPFDRALAATVAAAAAFTADPELLRPLYRFLLGVEDPVHRPKFMMRALAYWEHRLSPLAKAGMLPKSLSLIEFARDYQIFFAGALDLWVQRELNDVQFQAQIRHGGILRLLALGSKAPVKKLMSQLAIVSHIVKAAADHI